MGEIFWLFLILAQYGLAFAVFMFEVAFKVGVFLFGIIIEVAAANPKAALITSLVGGAAVLLFALLLR